MIEPVMYFGIGFLVAALLGLLFVPLVHNRAVRLTMRRLEAATPLSISEIRADKDQLRAEFAMSTRRLEMSVEKMKTKTTSQLAELGKKSDAINQLKKELGEKTATIFALEARDKTLRDQLRATEEEFQIKSGSLREAERQLADKEAELTKLLGELGERSLVADSQRTEIAAFRTQVEAMKVSVSDYEHAVAETEQRLGRERADAEAAGNELTVARGKLGDLGTRTSDLERQLFVQTTEAEILNRRVQDLETRLGDQGRMLADRDYQLDRMRSELEAARKTETDLRSEVATSGSRSSNAVDRFRTDIVQLEAQLAAAIEERTKLQREIGTMKRDAESTWAAERVENALLRERINDVAAEVARLTAALEGPGSPIESILAVEAACAGRGTSGASSGRDSAAAENGDTASENKNTLADRIRALQSTASRVASTN
jgi:predicted  nucleic acid-binding Zn-ribbon protein/chorismate mutase